MGVGAGEGTTGAGAGLGTAMGFGATFGASDTAETIFGDSDFVPWDAEAACPPSTAITRPVGVSSM